MGEVLDSFKTKEVITVGNEGKLLAVIYKKQFLKALVQKKLKKEDPVKKCWSKDFVLFD